MLFFFPLFLFKRSEWSGNNVCENGLFGSPISITGIYESVYRFDYIVILPSVYIYISPYNIETSSYKILFLPEDKGEVWDAAVNITNLWVV